MTGGYMPLWLAVPWSIAMTVTVSWQPAWAHRLFDSIADGFAGPTRRVGRRLAILLQFSCKLSERARRVPKTGLIK